MINNVHFFQIESSWDEGVLKHHQTPQSVKITTPGFFNKYYPQFYYWDWGQYFADREGFYQRIPVPLKGKLEYKGAIDFMDSTYLRDGIVACVSKKVKDILQNNMVAPNNYYLIPIELSNEIGDFFVFFIPFLSLSELKINYALTHFIINEKDTLFQNETELANYLLNHDNPLRTSSLCLDVSLQNLDIINAGFVHGYIYFSERIIKAFGNSGIVGFSVKHGGTIGTCPLVFS